MIRQEGHAGGDRRAQRHFVEIDAGDRHEQRRQVIQVEGRLDEYHIVAQFFGCSRLIRIMHGAM